MLADKTCAGKGIFVIAGNDITVRNLTFARAAVPDRNGAGIRAEGRNLTVEHSRFIDNENGILANPKAGSTIRIVDSEFRGNAKCDGQCAHGIYVNAIDRLEIEHSRFIDQHIGHHIKSRARNTVLIDNDIADGPNGNSSYLVDIPNGGDLLMQGNRLRKGKMAENTGTAVPIGEEGVKNPTHDLIIRDNNFTSDLPAPTVFVRNRHHDACHAVRQSSARPRHGAGRARHRQSVTPASRPTRSPSAGCVRIKPAIRDAV